MVINMEPQLNSGLLWKKVSYNETLKGIPLEKKKYPEESHHIVVAWQVLRQDKESNKNYSKSTIEHFIMVCRDAKLRVPGYYISWDAWSIGQISSKIVSEINLLYLGSPGA